MQHSGHAASQSGVGQAAPEQPLNAELAKGVDPELVKQAAAQMGRYIPLGDAASGAEGNRGRGKQQGGAQGGKAAKKARQEGQAAGGDDQQGESDQEADAGGEDLPTIERYSYGALDDLRASMKGFAITCNFRSEKSATKEAVQLLCAYLPEQQQQQQQQPQPDGAAAAGAPATADASDAKRLPPPLALVKLDTRGVVVLKLAPHLVAAGVGPTAVVREIVKDVESGKRPAPKHVLRVTPLEGTCPLNLQAVEAQAQAVAKEYQADRSLLPEAIRQQLQQEGAEAPGAAESNVAQLEYAVSWKNRDPDSFKGQGAASGSGAQAAEQQQGEAGGEVDRMTAIKTLASAFEKAFEGDAQLKPKANLKKPQVAFLLEVIPAGRSLYAGLSLVPQDLITMKPRLLIKPIGLGTGGK